MNMNSFKKLLNMRVSVPLFVLLIVVTVYIPILFLIQDVASIKDAYDNDTKIVIFDWEDINNLYQYKNEDEAILANQKAHEAYAIFEEKGYLILDAQQIYSAPKDLLIDHTFFKDNSLKQ